MTEEGAEVLYLPAGEMARRVRARELSPVALVEASLARIEAVNSTLNCFCFTYPDEALAKAREAERAATSGGRLGPLHGVPIALKDFTPTRGKTTTRGSHVFADWVPEADPPVVERLLGAGAILVGKTTTPELAYTGFTHSPLWGVTCNPWDPARTPGGSSGGSAAAVASGCVPLAEGSDAGGSVRIPAAFCGVVGFKPSLGRIPVGVLPTAFDPLFHFGPLARSVADAALFVNVTQGFDPRDPLSQPAPAPLELPGEPALRDLRLGLSPDLGFYAVDDEVATNVRAAADALAGAGAEVESVRLGWTKAVADAWELHWCVLLAACYGRYLKRWRERMDPDLVEMMEVGLTTSAVQLKRTELVRTEAWRELTRVFERCDALLCPTTARPPPEHHRRERNFQTVDREGRLHGLFMTEPFNLLGQCPALSVPSGVTAGGLPTALQVVGRPYDDATTLAVGAALEALRPWARRRPPL